MRRLWIALALLAAVFCGTLFNSWYLADLTGALSRTLAQAEARAEGGAWEEAEALTRQAYEAWSDWDVYLHVLLRHGDTDQVYTGFREVLEFLTCQEGGEYSAANARLIAQIELLSEAEQLTLKNIL